MLTVRMEPRGLIAAVFGLADSYKKHVEHYRKTGWPEFADKMTREHLTGMEEAHASLLLTLREAGWPMLGKDLELADHDELAAIPWNPPART